MMHVGTVEEIDEDRVMVKVKLPAHDDMVTHWLHLLVGVSLNDKSYQIPEEGTQVVILLDPRGEDGVVLGAIYSEVDKPPVSNKKKWHKTFADGTYLEYDKNTHELVADVKGKVDIKATQNVTVKSDLAIDAEGLSIKAKATTTAEVEAQAIQLKAQLVNVEAPMTIVENLTVKGKITPLPLP